MTGISKHATHLKYCHADCACRNLSPFEVQTPSKPYMSVTASLKTSVGKLKAALQQHFENTGRGDLDDGKLLWNGMILAPHRTVNSYQVEFLELFGPVDWVRSQYGD